MAEVGAGQQQYAFALEAADQFGGADGYGANGHDSADNLEIEDQDAFDAMMAAAGNTNQYHKSDLGREQLALVFSAGEALGMMKDGKLSAEEMQILEKLNSGEMSAEDAASASTALGNQVEGTIDEIADLQSQIQANVEELMSGSAGSPQEGGGNAAVPAEESAEGMDEPAEAYAV